jgi:adenylate cyclase
MHLLDDSLEQTRAGNGQVVGVVAPAGTGKSRLCFEFTERCRAARLEVFEGHAVAHGKNIPFLPILQIFRAYFGVLDGDSDRTVREKVAGRLLLIDEALREDLPVLFEFLGVPDPDAAPLHVDAEARQQKLFALIHRLAHDDEGAEPRIYVVEDLHWIDGGSERFLEQMVEAIAGTRNLLLVNFRPEYHASWMSRSWYRQLPLAPLGPDAIRELLDDLIGQDESTAGLAESIHARTGGNPFFTEEVVQSLIESGHLEGGKGAYRLVTPIERLAVPASVHAVLAARIDRLIEREKQVLQAAAVIGKDFVRPILEDVVELSSAELDLAISLLKDGEFVREQALYPVAEYAFKHPLTQEVALDSLLGDRRRALHRAVALAIESVRADALDENAALLAHHWESAAEAGTAARWHRRAALWVGTTDSAQALRHWQRVRELLAGHDGDDELQLRLAACHGIMAAGWRIGVEKDAWEELYREGRSIAERLEDGDGEALLVQVYSRGLPGMGEVARYVEVCEEGLRLADRIVDVGTQANAWILGMDAGQWLGQYDRMVELGDEYVARFPDDPAVGFEIWQVGLYPLALTLRGVGLCWMARFDEALADFERSTELGQELEQWELVNWGNQMLSALAWLRGDAARGPVYGRRAVEACERAGSTPALRTGAARGITLGHMAARDWDAAIASAREWLELHEREQVELQVAIEGRALLCEALRRAGRYPEVLELAERTIEDAMRMPRRASEVIARHALAVALAHVHGTDARDRVAEVLAPTKDLITRSHAWALGPQRHEALAHVARALGDRDTHEGELREAHRLYVELACPQHAARLAQELEEA